MGQEHDFFNHHVDVFNDFNCCLTKEEINHEETFYYAHGFAISFCLQCF